MKLSERLELVLSFVKPGESAADVGTDHGHVPVELVRRTIVKKAVAMDVRKGPLSRATENIALPSFWIASSSSVKAVFFSPRSRTS